MTLREFTDPFTGSKQQSPRRCQAVKKRLEGLLATQPFRRICPRLSRGDIYFGKSLHFKQERGHFLCRTFSVANCRGLMTSSVTTAPTTTWMMLPGMEMTGAIQLP